MVTLFSHSCYKREIDKWINSLKYYSLNALEPLETDTTPWISKILLERYDLGLLGHAQK